MGSDRYIQRFSEIFSFEGQKHFPLKVPDPKGPNQSPENESRMVSNRKVVPIGSSPFLVGMNPERACISFPMNFNWLVDTPKSGEL